MAKANYAFEKKRREQLKKQKKAEKSQKKLIPEAAPEATETPQPELPVKPTT